MNFAEDIAWILIVCAISYPLYALFFVLAHFYKKKTQRGSGCTVFLKATVIEPLRIRIKHSYHYFMIYQYEYMGCVYQKTPASIWPIIRRRRRSELRWRFTLTHLIRKNTSVPADVKMYRMIQICLLCCGWLAIVGTPIACFILEYLY